MNRILLIIVGLAVWLNSLSQNVGVGTLAPTARLHVWAPSGVNIDLFKVEVNNSSHFVVQANGKVGIGTINPSQTLDVAGNIQFSGALMPNGNAGTAGQVLISQGPGASPQWQSIGGSGGIAGLCSTPTNNYVQKWTGTELCNSVIYDDGINVGIGTTSPSRKLTVMDTTGSTSGALYARQMVNNPSSWTLGAYIVGRGVASSNNSTTVTGLYAYGAWQPANGVTINSNATGLYTIGTNDGAGTLTYAYGIRSYVQLPSNGSGTITRGYAIYARCKDAQNCYGVYISGDPNNNQDWGLYVNNNADRNYIAGSLGIGVAPTAKLDVAGDIQFSGELKPGGNPGTIGQVLVSQGAGMPPQWTTLTMASGLQGDTFFSTPGTYQWIVPSGVRYVIVSVMGGGGGGGKGNCSGCSGGGGGAGGFAVAICPVIPGDTVTVVVGAGGTGGTAYQGTAGGNSSFDTCITATGGAGGLAHSQGGTGGSGGTILPYPAPSKAPVLINVIPGQSGTRRGGSSLFGSGGTYTACCGGMPGGNGTGYGAGGGGGWSGGYGGNGSGGFVAIRW